MGLAIGACLLLAGPALDLRLQSDARRLLPAEAPAVQDFQALITTFGASEQTVVVARAPTPDRLDDLGRTLDAVAAGLDASPAPGGGPWLESLSGAVDVAAGRILEDQVLPWTWLAFDPARLDRLIRGLDPRVVRRRLDLGGRPDVAPHRADRDPLGLWTDLFEPFWRGHLPRDLPLVRRAGRLVTRDGCAAVLILRPSRPAQDAEFSTAFAAALERAVAAEQAGDLRVEAVGGHLVAAADYATAHQAAITTLIQGSAGILLLFGLLFRNLRLVVFLAVTLVPAGLAALGCARLLIGPELSLLVTAFAVVLIGLGVDFTIHLDAACARRLAAGEDRPSAARNATADLRRDILAGGSTSILAFLILMLSAFPGFRELGLVAGIGLGLMLAQVLVATPAFLARWGRPARLAPGIGRRMGTVLGARRWPALALVGGLVLGIALSLIADGSPLHFDGRARNLRPKDDPLWEKQVRLAREAGLGTDQIHLLFTAPTPEAVLTQAADAVDGLRHLVDAGRIADGEWRLIALLDPARQHQACRRLADEVAWDDLMALEAVFPRFAPFFADLRAWRERAGDRRIFSGDDLAGTTLSAPLRSTWIRDGHGVHLALRLDPAAGVDPGSLMEPLRAAAPTARITGVPILAAFLADALAADFASLGWFSLGAVVILLAIHLRSVVQALTAITSLGLGIAVAQVALHHLGVPWNLLNVAALPLLFGLGIDAAIYVIAALARHGDDPAGRSTALGEVIPPLLMTTATTVIGFASLLLNPYRGLQSLGWVAIVGMVCCLVTALAVPLLLHRRR